MLNFTWKMSLFAYTMLIHLLHHRLLQLFQLDPNFTRQPTGCATKMAFRLPFVISEEVSSDYLPCHKFC